MKTNTQRVKDFLDRLDIDEAVFNKTAELGNAAVSNNLKNGGSFSERSLEKILRNYPDIRKEWLYWEQGKMLHSDPNIEETETTVAMELKNELIEINRKYQKLLEMGNQDKDKIIELLQEIDKLKDKLRKAG